MIGWAARRTWNDNKLWALPAALKNWKRQYGALITDADLKTRDAFAKVVDADAGKTAALEILENCLVAASGMGVLPLTPTRLKDMAYIATQNTNKGKPIDPAVFIRGNADVTILAKLGVLTQVTSMPARLFNAAVKASAIPAGQYKVQAVSAQTLYALTKLVWDDADDDHKGIGSCTARPAVPAVKGV